MPLDRVLGPLFDALGDPPVGRRARWCRAGSLPLLPLIFLLGFVVITALAYASPQDPTWIAGLYDAADYDDEIRLLTDPYTHTNPAGEIGRPAVIGPMSAVLARVAACSSAAGSQIAVLFAYRLRAPPKRRTHGSFFFLGLLTLRNARNLVPAAVQSLPKRNKVFPCGLCGPLVEFLSAGGPQARVANGWWVNSAGADPSVVP